MSGSENSERSINNQRAAHGDGDEPHLAAESSPDVDTRNDADVATEETEVDKVAELEGKLQEAQDRALRAQAELENFRFPIHASISCHACIHPKPKNRQVFAPCKTCIHYIHVDNRMNRMYKIYKSMLFGRIAI